MDNQKYLETIKLLNYYTKKYDEGQPEISDKEWDDLYFEIKKFEEENNFIAEDSPTNYISFTINSGLKKVTHNHPMLSLTKTKDINVIKQWSKGNNLVAMSKMDGLTCSLLYENGQLIQAETRGNGRVGENITHNALVINSIPKQINFKNRLIVDGEVICKYDDFEYFSDIYKNPRNFASGSIRLLDSNECSKRKLTFVAWDLIEGIEHENFNEDLKWLEEIGFIVVPYEINDPLDYNLIIQKSKELNYPIDGLVYRINNNKLWKSLGRNEYAPDGSKALKLYDEVYETELLDITWSIGRTGIITPVAKFKNVKIDGTDVQNASLHNLIILENTLGIPYVSQKVWVFKANAIIPQIEKAEKNFDLTKKQIYIPHVCPSCGEKLAIEQKYNTKLLKCNNKNCSSQKINRFLNFVGANGLDIETLSIGTITKLIDFGWLNTLSDLFELKNHKEEWLQKDGFGEKSVNTILDNIEKSKNIELWKIIASVGITNVERQTAKLLADVFKTYENFKEAINNNFDFTTIKGIGSITEKNIKEFDYSEIDDVMSYLIITEDEQTSSSNKLNNKTFCVTGKLNIFNNRDEIIKTIEKNGGKFTGVNKNLDYLISNDLDSTSGKTKKAKDLGIKIISEEDFIQMLS